MDIYLLTIHASHEFDAVVHQSAHKTREGAWAYAEEHALPDARLGEEPEWHKSFIASVEEVAILS